MSDDAQHNPLAGWHLDKRVPIALIVTLLVQAMGFGMWVGSLDSRVEALETEAADRQDIRDRLTRLEVQIEERTQTILERLDRQEERP